MLEEHSFIINRFDNSQKKSFDSDDVVIDGLSLFLKTLARSSFFGGVEIQFSDGHVVLVRKEESFKPVVFLSK